ncbi:hypothetical protein JTB14_033892 [Gonioctena quinquepunctata]|nr:hypothetical protein JTB14_033892 [Gonioctena quinquepunctata]
MILVKFMITMFQETYEEEIRDKENFIYNKIEAETRETDEYDQTLAIDRRQQPTAKNETNNSTQHEKNGHQKKRINQTQKESGNRRNQGSYNYKAEFSEFVSADIDSRKTCLRKHQQLKNVAHNCSNRKDVREVVARIQFINKTAIAFGISRAYLAKIIKKSKNTEEYVHRPNIGNKRIFSETQGHLLVSYLKTASNICHGLTKKQTGESAFRYAEANNICTGKWRVDKITSGISLGLHDEAQGFVSQKT